MWFGEEWLTQTLGAFLNAPVLSLAIANISWIRGAPRWGVDQMMSGGPFLNVLVFGMVGLEDNSVRPWPPLRGDACPPPATVPLPPTVGSSPTHTHSASSRHQLGPLTHACLIQSIESSPFSF